MDDTLIKEVTARVIERLAGELGADGGQGRLIAVVTGATVGFPEAVDQLRRMVLDGWQLKLAFSSNAAELFESSFSDGLAGFPFVEKVDPAKWLGELNDARGVVVPLLSVNTLSKVSMLIADNLAVNLILHALFMGKPVFAARNGADPGGPGRSRLGWTKGAPALGNAIVERFSLAAAYGCKMVDVSGLCAAMHNEFSKGNGRGPDVPGETSTTLTKKVLTAVDVQGFNNCAGRIVTAAGTIVTPLAWDLARQRGVKIVVET